MARKTIENLERVGIGIGIAGTILFGYLILTALI